ncbi:MAG: TonB-dependent receptor [Marinagarivorans sp.]|nr:TonB-dependent receptor [Marinagarivorans sp.]
MRGQRGRFDYELALFRMDFDNQIIPANSNSDFQRTSGGKTLHQGLEAALLVELGAGFTLKTSATHIADAEFSGNRLDANNNITTADGNRITYTPEWVVNASLEYEAGDLRTALSVHHNGKQYTDTNNTIAIAENTSGFFTGQIDGYTTLDLNAVYDINTQLSVNATVKNLADEDYIASLRQGIYVGTERSVDAGIRYQF